MMLHLCSQENKKNMEPKQNDVLSGRGACFNQHPGNKHFRRILDTHIDLYTKGTKKQKMIISHAIVDAVYSLEPPGRFLKKCDNSTIWRELSRKEASNKAAQAMAYAVRAESKLKPQIHAASPQSHASSSSHVTKERNTASTSASAASRPNPNAEDIPRGNHELNHDKPSIQQQLLQRQQSQSNTIPFTSNSAFTAPQNGDGLTSLARAYLLSQAQIQQQNHLQQQLQLRSQYLLGQHTLLPSSQHSSSSIQSLSDLGRIPPSLDFLRLEQNSYGAGAQTSSSVHRQSNVNGLHDASSNYNIPNQSMFNAAIASQHGASQLQDQEMLRNLLMASSLAAFSSQPQSQQLGLAQRRIALLQQNLQYTHPNISAQGVEVGLREDNTAPALNREWQGRLNEGEGGGQPNRGGRAPHC